MDRNEVILKRRIAVLILGCFVATWIAAFIDPRFRILGIVTAVLFGLILLFLFYLLVKFVIWMIQCKKCGHFRGKVREATDGSGDRHLECLNCGNLQKMRRKSRPERG